MFLNGFFHILILNKTTIIKFRGWKSVDSPHSKYFERCLLVPGTTEPVEGTTHQHCWVELSHCLAVYRPSGSHCATNPLLPPGVETSSFWHFVNSMWNKGWLIWMWYEIKYVIHMTSLAIITRNYTPLAIRAGEVKSVLDCKLSCSTYRI